MSPAVLLMYRYMEDVREHVASYGCDQFYRHSELREIVRDVPADAAVIDRDRSGIGVGRDERLQRSPPYIYIRTSYDDHVLIAVSVIFHWYSFRSIYPDRYFWFLILSFQHL